MFLVTVLSGYAVLAGLTILAGFLLTRVILDIGGIAEWDQRVAERLEDSRTPTLVDLSYIGSTLSGGIVIPIFVGVLLVCFLAVRRFRLAAVTLFLICVESGTYRVTSLIVHRDRPDVERLEGLPVNESFPSGHVAASVALYSGLLLVLASRVSNLWTKLAIWALAVAIPVFEIWSRMIRGMHHATDVTFGVLMGIGAIIVTVVAARVAGAAAARRDAENGTDRAAKTGGAQS